MLFAAVNTGLGKFTNRQGYIQNTFFPPNTPGSKLALKILYALAAVFAFLGAFAAGAEGAAAAIGAGAANALFNGGVTEYAQSINSGDAGLQSLTNLQALD